VERGGQLEGFDEFSIGSVNLDAGVFFLNADINIASGVHGDLAMAIANGLLAGRWGEPVWSEFVFDFSDGDSGAEEEGE
jgi:hypothetical protein